MTLQDILLTKGSAVHTIEPEATLDKAARTLVKHRVGSLLVCNRDLSEGGEQLVGIVTERDLLYCSAERQCLLSEVKVSEVMTTELFTGTPEKPVEEVMGVMTAKRIRHLPVLSDGRLVGIISIGDVVKAQFAQLALENRFMKDYIQS